MMYENANVNVNVNENNSQLSIKQQKCEIKKSSYPSRAAAFACMLHIQNKESISLG